MFSQKKPVRMDMKGGNHKKSTHDKPFNDFNKRNLIPLNQSKTNMVVKKPNGNYVLVSIQGENYDGDELPVDIDWKHLKCKALILLEYYNMKYDLFRATYIALNKTLGDCKPRICENIFRNFKRIVSYIERGKFMYVKEMLKSFHFHKTTCLNNIFMP